MNCEPFQGVPPAFLTYAAVSARTGLSISSIRRMAARADFPAPVELMPRRPAFPAAEVERWIAARIAEREEAAA